MVIIFYAILMLGGTGLKGAENKVTDAAFKNILNRSTLYCDKLKKMAFAFYCREKITEKLEWYGKLKRRKSQSHNYQLTIRNGKITEIRDKLKKGSKQPQLVKQSIKTYFYSNYSIFLPLSCFSRKARRLHHYRMLGKEKILNWDTCHVEFFPGGTNDENVKGEAWLAIEDGAVLKIKVHPDSIVGIEKMREEASKYGTEMEIEDIHWYLKEDMGIHFPSRTLFIETHYSRNLNNERLELEKRSTEIIYEDYQFFKIVTEITKESQLDESPVRKN